MSYDSSKKRWKARDGTTKKWLPCPESGRVSFKTEKGAARVYLAHLRANPAKEDEARRYAERLAADEEAGATETEDEPRRVSSRHRGVSFNSKLGRWEARTTINGMSRWIGRFDTEERAAAAVNAYLDKNRIDPAKRPRNDVPWGVGRLRRRG